MAIHDTFIRGIFVLNFTWRMYDIISVTNNIICTMGRLYASMVCGIKSL